MTITLTWKTVLDLAILVFAVIGLATTIWLVPAFLRGFRTSRAQMKAQKNGRLRRADPK